MRRRPRDTGGRPPLAAAALLGVARLAGSALAQDTTLRVAMGSPGRGRHRVWDDIAAQFEAAHPGVDVEMNYQDDDLYQTIGLPNAAAGPERAGRLLRVDRQPHGAARRRRLRRRPHRGRDLRTARRHRRRRACCRPASVDGKVVLMPHTADVTNVLWYNVPLLAEHGVTPPTTWEELLAACDTLDRGGHHADRDAATRTSGPAGNWLSHIGVARRRRGGL